MIAEYFNKVLKEKVNMSLSLYLVCLIHWVTESGLLENCEQHQYDQHKPVWTSMGIPVSWPL